VTTEINLHVPALLTSVYCPDVHERLVLYKRLANANDDDELDTLQEELIDRFGLLPEQGEALLACHRLRIAAKPLGIIKIDASDSSIQLQFNIKADLDPMKLVNLLQRDRRCRMNGPDKLRVTVQLGNVAHRAEFVKTLLKEFA
jgi:transcription-repair coupling factor (superfamily II helicase)